MTHNNDTGVFTISSTNTTYSAGDGLTLNGTEFSLNIQASDVPTLNQDTTGNAGGISGVLDISKDGEVAKFQPATAGQYTLVNFNSKVNSGSDKGFILVQDESANSPGTGGEDLRMTIGVHNDFRSTTDHSDELWFQGGGRLCYNVGEWDSELNTIIGTPGFGTSHGGVNHEWRINNSAKMTLNTSGLYLNDGWFRTYGSQGWYNETHQGGWYMTDSTWMRTYNEKSIWAGSGNICCSGNMGAGTSTPGYKLEVNGTSRFDGEMQWGLGHTSHAGYSTNNDWYIRSGSSSGKVIIQDTGGYVGVGTASPAQKLDVAGRIRADTMEIDSYIYHVDDTDTYFGFDDNDHFRIVEGGATRLQVDSTGNIGLGTNAPAKTLDVRGTLRCDEMFYGDTYTYYESSSLTCTKSRRSSGDPSIFFTINAVPQVGWIPYTFQLYGSAVNSDGGSHFQRIGEGHGRYYNGSNSTSGVTGVTFTAYQSGDRGVLYWTMDDVGRNYTVFTCTLTCYEGIIE